MIHKKKRSCCLISLWQKFSYSSYFYCPKSIEIYFACTIPKSNKNRCAAVWYGAWGMGQVAWAVSLECRAKPIENFIMVTTIFSQRNWHENVVHELFTALGKLSPERGGEKKKKNTETTENTGKTCVLKLCTAKKKKNSCLHPTARQSRPPTAAASYASLHPKTELITFFGSCCSSSSSFSPPGPICNLNNMAAPAKYPNHGDKSTGKEKRKRRRRSAVDFILAP